MELGLEKKKITVSPWIKFEQLFMAVLSLILGIFLVILTFISKKEDSNILLWIGLGLVLSSGLHLLNYVREKKLAGNYIFYEKGFEDAGRNIKVPYKDVKNYYFSIWKVFRKDVQYMIIEGKEDKYILTSRLGSKVFDIFVQDYLKEVLPVEIENIKNGGQRKFGILNKAEMVKSKFGLNENKIIDGLKNMDIKEEVTIYSSGIKIGDKIYSMNDIKNVKKDLAGTLSIIDNENKVIFSKNKIFIQSFDLMVNLLKEFLDKK
ncbi:MAG: hypothetical protein Q4D53_00375 [Leptotrichiaceae bacterium]|nr:hypothetical protein [Leptotrichiaceae bacterium]